ncbi:MAG TPA: hemerythrin domain-containing protein [Kofleriaceae bacterium]|nr:hemerythrin domain-containing protein [Kofleriaceae bacterium]
MLTPLGRARPADADSLVELLAACHARIRHHAELAVTLAAPAAAAQPATAIAEAAAAVARYFSVALPLHAADEDHSLAPRLIRAFPAVAPALTHVAADHAAHDAAVARVLAPVAALAADPTRRAELAPVLAAAAEDLRAAFAAHLALEEAEVFPLVPRLPAAEQAAVIAELRARRR